MDGVTHAVATLDLGGAAYGVLRCGELYFWRNAPLDESDRNPYRRASPMNPMKDKENVTCLVCLASS